MLALPEGEDFFEFRLICNDYSKSLYVLLATPLAFDDRVEQDLRHARDLCCTIWAAFAHSARIHAHDPYYDKDVAGWTAKRDAIMASLRSGIRDFSDSVDRLPVPRENLSHDARKALAEFEAGRTSVSDARPVDEHIRAIDGFCK